MKKLMLAALAAMTVTCATANAQDLTKAKIDSLVCFFDLGSSVVTGSHQLPANTEVLGIYAGADEAEWVNFGTSVSKALDGGLIVDRARNFGQAVGLKKFFVGTLVERQRVAKIFYRHLPVRPTAADTANAIAVATEAGRQVAQAIAENPFGQGGKLTFNPRPGKGFILFRPFVAAYRWVQRHPTEAIIGTAVVATTALFLPEQGKDTVTTTVILPQPRDHGTDR